MAIRPPLFIFGIVTTIILLVAYYLWAGVVSLFGLNIVDVGTGIILLWTAIIVWNYTEETKRLADAASTPLISAEYQEAVKFTPVIGGTVEETRSNYYVIKNIGNSPAKNIRVFVHDVDPGDTPERFMIFNLAFLGANYSENFDATGRGGDSQYEVAENYPLEWKEISKQEGDVNTPKTGEKLKWHVHCFFENLGGSKFYSFAAFLGSNSTNADGIRRYEVIKSLFKPIK